LLMQFFRWR